MGEKVFKVIDRNGKELHISRPPEDIEKRIAEKEREDFELAKKLNKKDPE